MSLRIQFLGQPCIRRDGVLVNLPGNRPLALLAYLIVTKKAHRRQQLIDLLFDGPDDPRASLRWTLTKIRKAIGEEYLLTDREEISFNFESEYWVDATGLEAGELELYQGDFLEGLYLRNALRFDDWMAVERGRLRGLYQTGLEKQLEREQQVGDVSGVVITAQQLLKLDNLREDWHCALMEAYARLGQRSTALEQYERCRQAIQAEWEMELSPETTTLAEAIRGGEVGPPESISGGETRLPVVALEEQSKDQIFSPHYRPRVSLPRYGWARIAAIVLAIGSLLGLSRVVNINGQATLNDGKQPAIEDAASKTEVIPQALAGSTVWILGPFQDTYEKLIQQSMMPFEERTGIDVVFLTGEADYDLDLTNRLESGDLPDIVVFPQPGWLATLAKQGKIVNLSSFLDQDYLQQQYPEAFLDLVTVDGQVWGVWNTVDLKSLVWYPRRAFDAKGYVPPETWDELIALSDRIVADGGKPWCIGIEGLEGTGWVGTDWVEDILLRTAPPETYDAWVRHELLFDSPEIRRVFELMGQIWLNDNYVYGGTANISREGIVSSPLHMFEDPPGCYLHKQGSFAQFFFPPGAVYGQDYDFFYFPPIDLKFGRPVLGSGLIFAMVKDRPEVREVMRYLSTAESTEALIKNGGFLSPHRDTPIQWFPTEADLRFAQIVLSADTYRFDGSDLMPDQVGLGSFYRGITGWANGTDLGTVLQQIDQSWPTE